MGLELSDRIFIAGHKGMVGSAILRKLKNNGFKKILTADRNDLDLSKVDNVKKWFKNNKPDVVILAAAKVGGIDAILSAVSNEDSSATTAQIAKSSLDQLTKSATDNLSSIDSKSMVQLVEANAIVTDNEEKSRRKTPTKNALQVCVENLSNTD